jgi:regulator of replication initiation timing
VSYLERRLTVSEEFSSELEKFASHLVLENQSLQHENKQISGLLKEYESTLENVMSKFRGVAVSLKSNI